MSSVTGSSPPENPANIPEIPSITTHRAQEISVDLSTGYLRVGNDAYRLTLLVGGQEIQGYFSAAEMAQIGGMIKNILLAENYQFSDLDGVIVNRDQIIPREHTARLITQAQSGQAFQDISNLIQTRMPPAGRFPPIQEMNPSQPEPVPAQSQQATQPSNPVLEEQPAPNPASLEPPLLPPRETVNPPGQAPALLETESHPPVGIEPQLHITATIAQGVESPLKQHKWHQFNLAGITQKLQAFKETVQSKWEQFTASLPSFWKKNVTTDLPGTAEATAIKVTDYAPIPRRESIDLPGTPLLTEFSVEVLDPPSAQVEEISQVARDAMPIPVPKEQLLPKELMEIRSLLDGSKKAVINKEGQLVSKEITADTAGESRPSRDAAALLLKKTQAFLDDLSNRRLSREDLKKYHDELDPLFKGLETNSWMKKVMTHHQATIEEPYQALLESYERIFTPKYLTKDQVFEKLSDHKEARFFNQCLLGYRNFVKVKMEAPGSYHAQVSAQFFKDLQTAYEGIASVEEGVGLPALTEELQPNERKLNLLRFCTEWLKSPYAHGGDVQDPEVQTVLSDIASSAIRNEDPALKEAGRALLASLKSPVHAPNYSTEYHSLQPGKFYASSNGLLASIAEGRSYMRKDRKALVTQFAEDLNELSRPFFANMMPREFYKAKWNTDVGEVLSPNIKEITRLFNSVSSYVANQVLAQPDPKKRDKIVKFFKDVAEASAEKGDFNSATAILAAFKSNALHRLVEVTDALDKLKGPAKTLDVQGVKMRKAVQEKLAKGEEAMPYLGTYLTLILKSEEGNKDTETEFNATKMKLIANLSNEVTDLQKNIKPTGRMFSDIHLAVRSKDMKSEDELDLISLILQPPESGFQRVADNLDQYLKVEAHAKAPSDIVAAMNRLPIASRLELLTQLQDKNSVSFDKLFPDVQDALIRDLLTIKDQDTFDAITTIVKKNPLLKILQDADHQRHFGTLPQVSVPPPPPEDSPIYSAIKAREDVPPPPQPNLQQEIPNAALPAVKHRLASGAAKTSYLLKSKKAEAEMIQKLRQEHIKLKAPSGKAKDVNVEFPPEEIATALVVLEKRLVDEYEYKKSRPKQKVPLALAAIYQAQQSGMSLADWFSTIPQNDKDSIRSFLIRFANQTQLVASEKQGVISQEEFIREEAEKLQELRELVREGVKREIFSSGPLKDAHKNLAVGGAVKTGEEEVKIVSDFYNLGSIDHVDTLTPEQTIEGFIGATKGLAALHALDIAHGDIAARNILGRLKLNPKTNQVELRFAISDWGRSGHVEGEQERVLESRVGPLKWMAPENVRNSSISKAGDTYSMGIAIIERVAGDLDKVFENMSGMDLATQVVLNAGFSQRLWLNYAKVNKVDKNLANLVASCLSFNPADRPTAIELAEGLQVVLENSQRDGSLFGKGFH